MPVDVKKLRGEIEEIGPRSVRQEAVADAIREVAAEHREVTTEIDAAKKLLEEEQLVEPTYGRLAREDMRRSLGWLAGGLTVADMFAQYATLSTQIGGLTPLQWGLIAPGVTALFAIGTHGTAVVSTHDPVRPGAAVRRCMLGAKITGAVTAGALTVFMFSRSMTSDMVPVMLPIVRSSLWVVAEAMPICAGFLTAAVSALNLRRRHEQRIKKMTARVEALERFHAWLLDEQARLATPPSSSTPAAAAVILAIIMLFTGAPAALAAGQTTRVPASEAKVTLRVADAPIMMPSLVRCDVRIDESDSVDPIARRDFVQLLRDHLLEVVAALKCSALRFGWFADDGGAFAPTQEWSVPQQPNKQCSQPVVVEAGVFGALKSVQEYTEKQANEACAKTQEDARRAYARDIAKFVESVTAAFKLREPRKTCTALAAMLSYSMSTATGPVINATDGADTCSATKALPQHAKVPVYIILMPKAGRIRDEGPAAIERAAVWQRRMPTINVVPYNAFGTVFGVNANK
jgi:hypothetical protein